MKSDPPHIAIIGGGISGLAAAYHLANLPKAPAITVLEQGDRLGGVLQTESHDGFVLELGPDSMLARLPWGMDLCREIGLSEQLVSTSTDQQGVHVVCRGQLQRVPEGLAIMAPQRIWPFIITPTLSWPAKFRLGAERLIPRRTAESDESLAAFCRRRLGRETFERLVQPLAGGIYMGDPEQLSIRSTFPQFVDMETNHGSLTRAARAAAAQQQEKSPHSGGPEYSMFVAPARGAAQLIEALAQQLTDCQLRCQQQVKSLTAAEASGWTVEVLDQGTGVCSTEHYDGVLVATPAFRAAALLEAADTALAQKLERIPYAGCTVINLAYPREAIPHPLDSFGFVVPHVEQRKILACTFSSVKYPGRAPEGTVLLRAFLGGACYPEVMDWTDEQVVATARDELGSLLGMTQPPQFTRITRWRRSMPQYHLGHQELVQSIEQRVAELPGLELAGNAYQGVGIPHCIRVGQQAAARLAAALQPAASQAS